MSRPEAPRRNRSPDAWTFRAVIYMWGPQITGSATFPGGNAASFGMDFGEILDHLKMTGMGTLEAQKGPWGAFTDVVYMNVGGTKTRTRDGTIDGVPIPVGVTLNTGMDLKSWVWTLAGSYRVQATAESEMDVFAGARMFTIEPRLTYDFSADVGPFVGPGRTGARIGQGKGLECDRRRQGSRRLRRQSRMVHPVLRSTSEPATPISPGRASAGIGYAFHWGDAIAHLSLSRLQLQVEQQDRRHSR